MPIHSSEPLDVYQTCGTTAHDHPPAGTLPPLPDATVGPLSAGYYIGWQNETWAGYDSGYYKFLLDAEAVSSPVTIAGFSTWEFDGSPEVNPWTDSITVSSRQTYEIVTKTDYTRMPIIGIMGPISGQIIVHSLCMVPYVPEPPPCIIYYDFRVSNIDGAGTAAVPGTVYNSIYNHANGQTYTTTDTNPDYILYPFKVSEFNNIIADAPFSSAKWFEGHFDQLDKTYQDLSYKLIISNQTLTGNPPTGFHKQRAVDLQFDRDDLGVYSIFAESYLQGSASYLYYSVFIEDAENVGTELSENYVPYPENITLGYKNQGTLLYSDIDGVLTEQAAVNPDIPVPGNARTTVWIGEASEIVIYCSAFVEPPVPPQHNPLLDFVVPPDRSVYLDLVSKDNPLAGWMPGRFKEENDTGTLQVVKNYYGQRMDVPLLPDDYITTRGGT